MSFSGKYTPEQVNPSKLELERWSAEVVMDWTDSLHANFDDRWYGIKDKYFPHIPTTKIIMINSWHPLTDANQCFMVENKMREKGWFLVLETNESDEGERYSACFYNNDIGLASEVKHDNFKQSILEAARLAIGGRR